MKSILFSIFSILLIHTILCASVDVKITVNRHNQNSLYAKRDVNAHSPSVQTIQRAQAANADVDEASSEAELDWFWNNNDSSSSSQHLPPGMKIRRPTAILGVSGESNIDSADEVSNEAELDSFFWHNNDNKSVLPNVPAPLPPRDPQALKTRQPAAILGVRGR